MDFSWVANEPNWWVTHWLLGTLASSSQCASSQYAQLPPSTILLRPPEAAVCPGKIELCTSYLLFQSHYTLPPIIVVAEPLPWTLPGKVGPEWFVVQMHRCGSVVNPASWVWTAREAMEGQCAPQYHPHHALRGSISSDLFSTIPK